jgi:hypothetical protein
MNTAAERRKEQRLSYQWPVWFAENFGEALAQGQMADVSSTGAAFTCYSHERCPPAGEELSAKFSVPRFDYDRSFEMESFTRTGRVCRVDKVDKFLNRVAIQFTAPLPFKPGQQAASQIDANQKLKAVTI